MSCQLCCPFLSLSPQRQTGCQCRGGQHAPRTNTPTANFCSVFIYPFASCPGWYKRQVNRWTRKYRNEMHFPADELQTSIVLLFCFFLNGRLEGPSFEGHLWWSGRMTDWFIKENQIFIFAPLNRYSSPCTLQLLSRQRPFLMKHSSLNTRGFLIVSDYKLRFWYWEEKKECREEDSGLH